MGLAHTLVVCRARTVGRQLAMPMAKGVRWTARYADGKGRQSLMTQAHNFDSSLCRRADGKGRHDAQLAHTLFVCGVCTVGRQLAMPAAKGVREPVLWLAHTLDAM